MKRNRDYQIRLPFITITHAHMLTKKQKIQKINIKSENDSAICMQKAQVYLF